MKRLIFSGLIAATRLAAALGDQTVVSHDADYYTADVRNTQLIYTKKNLPFAQEAARVEMSLQPAYEKAFGYRMDETLYVGLISEYNQIANGFSTPYPNNRQINYIGGALMPDYFTSASWLKTLLFHETCHNYQDNAKDNVISSSLHAVLRNGSFIIPWFTIPNMVESSFMLEGNAVLNESWHGNGGRLYSGRFKAATLLQAKAGYLTPARVYNDNYYFLYGSHFYTLGGFYNYYLAKTYGLEKTNTYWENHSHYWYWPFFTNNAMTDTVGEDFETTFDAWQKEMRAEAEHLVEAKGKPLAVTQFIQPLNGDADHIYFTVNETGRGTPKLIIYDKHTGRVETRTDSWMLGKVVRLSDGRYTTQGSRHVNPWRLYTGLFDAGAFITEGTQGKAVQGYLDDATPVHFDIATSFDRPQLYVGDRFYDTANSSVLVDGDDLYYCKQSGKTRTYYKNKTPLFSVQGYYGFPVGTDKNGALYFIGNTRYGSGLFRWNAGRFERMSPADTIVDARIVDAHKAVVTSMGADEAKVLEVSLSPKEESPYEETLYFEHEPYFANDDASGDVPKVDLNDSYYAFLDMHYSATNIMLGSDADAGFIYHADVIFADPLTQNALSFFVDRNLDEYTLAGASYSNSQYFIHYTIRGYGILDRPDDNVSDSDERRDFGLLALVDIPFVQSGYWQANLSGAYFQDYVSNSREPLSATLSVVNTKRYGASLFPNFLAQADIYGSSDRGTAAYGGLAAYKQGLPAEFYIGLDVQYSHSEAENSIDDHGIKIAPFSLRVTDPTTIVMPSIDGTAYAKSVLKTGGELKKVFNAAAYFFTFPVSLRREALYGRYNYYNIEDFAARTHEADEITAGLLFDTYVMNRLPVMWHFEYLYNDNRDVAENEHRFRFFIDLGL